jgi:hypothetical protein
LHPREELPSCARHPPDPSICRLDEDHYRRTLLVIAAVLVVP